MMAMGVISALSFCVIIFITLWLEKNPSLGTHRRLWQKGSKKLKINS
jgi:hypothetical protein